jgi:hypothetical protein
LISEALRLAARAAEFGEGDAEALWMAGRTIAALSDRKDEGLALIGKSIPSTRVVRAPGGPAASCARTSGSAIRLSNTWSNRSD